MTDPNNYGFVSPGNGVPAESVGPQAGQPEAGSPHSEPPMTQPYQPPSPPGMGQPMQQGQGWQPAPGQADPRYADPMYPGPMIPQRRPPLGLPGKLWGQAAVSAVIGYGVTLAFAALLIVSLALSGGTSDSLSAIPDSANDLGLSDSSDVSIVSLPIHAVAMSVFGTLNLSVSSGIEGLGADVDVSMSMSLFMPILLLTCAMVTSMAMWTRRMAKRNRVTIGGALALSGVTAATLAILTTTLSAIFSINVNESFTPATLTTAGVATFFGALAVGFVASAVTWVLRAGIWSTWVARTRVLANGSFRVAVTHMVSLVALGGLVAVVVTAIEVDDAAGVVAALGGIINLGGLIAVLGSFGGIYMELTGLEYFVNSMTIGGGNSSDIDPTMTVTAFSENVPGYMYAVVAVAVIACIGAAFLLSARRVYTRPGPITWALTIGSYAAIGLVMQLVLSISLSVSANSSLMPVDLGVSAVPAIWSFLVLGAWGAVVEVLARFVFPRAVARLKPATLRRLHKVSGVDRPAAPVYAQQGFGQQPYAQQGFAVPQGFGQPYAQQPHVQQPYAQQPQPQPQPPAAQPPTVQPQSEQSQPEPQLPDPSSGDDRFRPPSIPSGGPPGA